MILACVLLGCFYNFHSIPISYEPLPWFMILYRVMKFCISHITTGEHQFIEGQHKEECPKIPLLCPNKCRKVKNLLRKDMEAHRKECPLEMIQCEYHSVGCKRGKLARRDMENIRSKKWRNI